QPLDSILQLCWELFLDTLFFHRFGCILYFPIIDSCSFLFYRIPGDTGYFQSNDGENTSFSCTHRSGSHSLGIVVPLKLYENFTELEYLLLGLVSAVPSFLIPMLLVGKADGNLHWKDRYWVKKFLTNNFMFTPEVFPQPLHGMEISRH
ncbi:hypothetical protein S245_064969, partial [Arachis hypogaea]